MTAAASRPEPARGPGQLHEAAGAVGDGVRPPDLERLFDAHAKGMCRFVHRLTGSRERAEDVVQRVFEMAHRKRNELVDGPGMKRWLYSAARHQALHEVRGRLRHEARVEQFGHAPSGVPSTPDQTLEQLRQARRIEQCILAIPDAYREVFVLFEFERWSQAEIAEMLGIAPNTVATRHHRAKDAFRQAFGAWRSDE